MKNSNRWARIAPLALFGASLVVGAASWFVMSVDAEAGPRLAANAGRKAFMRKKLVASDQIVEGLTTPNVGLIRKGATAMIHMSKEAMWASESSPTYAQDSADFVRTAERLVKLANDRDLEGASHSYAQLIVQCVNCHRRVRGERVATIPTPQEMLAVLPP